MLGCAFGRGELLLKSGLKQEKLSVRPHYFLDCAQVFYTSRGGGSEAPIRRKARWGLQIILHGTSFIKLTSILVYVFYDYFLHSCTGRRT